MKIDLVIDRLVLDGFAPQSIDSEAVRLAMSAELMRMLQTQSVALTGSASPSLKTAALPAAASLHSISLGVGVAQALHGALGTPRSQTLAAGLAPARNAPAMREASS